MPRPLRFFIGLDLVSPSLKVKLWVRSRAPQAATPKRQKNGAPLSKHVSAQVPGWYPGPNTPQVPGPAVPERVVTGPGVLPAGYPGSKRTRHNSLITRLITHLITRLITRLRLEKESKSKPI